MDGATYAPFLRHSWFQIRVTGNAAGRPLAFHMRSSFHAISLTVRGRHALRWTSRGRDTRWEEREGTVNFTPFDGEDHTFLTAMSPDFESAVFFIPKGHLGACLVSEECEPPGEFRWILRRDDPVAPVLPGPPRGARPSRRRLRTPQGRGREEARAAAQRAWRRADAGVAERRERLCEADGRRPGHVHRRASANHTPTRRHGDARGALAEPFRQEVQAVDGAEPSPIRESPSAEPVAHHAEDGIGTAREHRPRPGIRFPKPLHERLQPSDGDDAREVPQRVPSDDGLIRTGR